METPLDRYQAAIAPLRFGHRADWALDVEHVTDAEWAAEIAARPPAPPPDPHIYSRAELARHNARR